MNHFIRDTRNSSRFVQCLFLAGCLLGPGGEVSAQSAEPVGEIHEVELVIMDEVPMGGDVAVLVRRAGQADVLAMASAHADVGTLLALMTLVRAVWDKDGVEAQSDAILRLREPSARVARGTGTERAYATHAIRRILAQREVAIPGVGRGRVVKAWVARSASE